MFGLSVERLLLLAVLAMFILGPERIPAAAAWAGRTLRNINSYAAGANQQLRRELGPDIDQLREPLAQLRQPLEELRAPLRTLRGMRDPRTSLTRYLLSEPKPDHPPATTVTAATAATAATAIDRESTSETTTFGSTPPQAHSASPPIDTDAT